jgi:hypothetical protein
MKIFNRHLYQMHRKRAAKLLPAHDFLRQEIENDIQDRLSLIKRDFHKVLIIGERVSMGFIDFLRSSKGAQHIDIISFCKNEPAHLPQGKSLNYIEMSKAGDEVLPVKSASYDLVIEAGQGHHINDLPGWLMQGRLALVADGLFMAVMAGGETLSQLKASLLAVENEGFGGASPRIAPFAHLQTMAGLMQRAGFALPVVDSDVVPVYYHKLETLLHDLRGMGENSCLDKPLHSYRGKDFFALVEAFYRQHFSATDGTLRADFELIYLHGWAPHESQQKPLRPGQGQTSLEEVL